MSRLENYSRNRITGGERESTRAAVDFGDSVTGTINRSRERNREVCRQMH